MDGSAETRPGSSKVGQRNFPSRPSLQRHKHASPHTHHRTDTPTPLNILFFAPFVSPSGDLDRPFKNNTRTLSLLLPLLSILSIAVLPHHLSSFHALFVYHHPPSSPFLCCSAVLLCCRTPPRAIMTPTLGLFLLFSITAPNSHSFLLL